jgi:uncharacterized protein
MVDYRLLDETSVLDYVFYPREYHARGPVNSFDLAVEVDEGVSVTCRFYKGVDSGPWILYFHGNGEVVSDYDELSSFYTRRKLNLVVADYRGYGESGGAPTLSGVVSDSHKIFGAVRDELKTRSFRQHIWIMGRSLGSMSALELAASHGDELMGIIIESGFISVTRLFNHLSVPVPSHIDVQKIEEEAIRMVSSVRVPVLVIHGEYDAIVPYSEGEDLYEQLGSTKKSLLMIPAADHNDIMFVGLEEYLGAIEKFIKDTDVAGRE